MKISYNIGVLILLTVIIGAQFFAAGCRPNGNNPLPAPCNESPLPSGGNPAHTFGEPSAAPGSLHLPPLTATLLKVGKADAVILQTEGLAMVIDTGEIDDGEKVVKFLKKRGISVLECLIITHYDKDHVGGACAVLNAFEIKRILLPDYEGTNREYADFKEALRTYKTEAERLTEETEFQFGSAKVCVQPPSSYNIADAAKDYDNNFSLLTFVQHGNNRLFFTGDIEKERISEWLKTEENPKCDFLKMPHHGVYDNILGSFLDAVQPEYAAICSSDKNPADKRTLFLLENRGIEVLETRNGKIVVTSDGNSIGMKQ